jgi:hypothetical protein
MVHKGLRFCIICLATLSTAKHGSNKWQTPMASCVKWQHSADMGATKDEWNIEYIMKKRRRRKNYTCTLWVLWVYYEYCMNRGRYPLNKYVDAMRHPREPVMGKWNPDNQHRLWWNWYDCQGAPPFGIKTRYPKGLKCITSVPISRTMVDGTTFK